MLYDIVFAIAHWWALIGLIAILVAELVICRGPIDRATALRLSRIDGGYLLFSILMLSAGFARAIFGAKGWAFYSGNPWFWIKIGLFALIGLLSVPPTLQFIRWKKLTATPGTSVAADQRDRARRWIHAELLLLLLMPIAAVLMARAVGLR